MTLVELLMVIVIVSILMAIAVPSYRGYILRAQRVEATRALVQAQAAQEKFFVQNNAYATTLNAAPPAGLGINPLSETGLYDIAMTLTGGGTGFRVTATPRPGGAQSTDYRCATLTLDSNGLKTALDVASADTTRECWR